MMRPLGFGAFIGARRRVIDLDGFSLAEFVDRPEDTVTRHTHEDAHFWFVLEGTYISSAAGLDGLCAPPTVIFSPAGTTHRDRFQTRGGRFLTLSIAPSLLARVGGERMLAERATGFPTGDLPWLGRRLRDELRQPDALSPLVLEGLALEVLAHAAREGRRAHPAPRLAAAFERIHDSFLERLTAQAIARELGLRPLTFARAFRKAYGCSPGEMLRRRRVTRAEELLRGQDLPLAEIALASGFADQAQFTRTFRRVTGVTPGRYRKLRPA